MRCTYKTISKVRLCVSDLSHLVEVVKRVIAGDRFDDFDEQQNTTLEPLTSFYGACETVSPYRPVTAVNIDSKITHVYYARFTDVSIEIDVKECALVVGGVNYRIDSIENLNNLNETLAFYCSISGVGLESNS